MTEEAVAAGAAAGRWRGLLVLLRLGNLPTVWCDVAAGALLAGAAWAPAAWLLVGASVSCSYLGGLALNDFWDREWDRRHRPERPIPVGAVPAAVAGLLGAGLLAGGLALLLVAPGGRGLLAGALLLVTIVAYDRWHKGNPAAPLLMALCRLLSYLVAGLALGGARYLPLLLGALPVTGYVLLLTVAARSRGQGRGGWSALPSVPWLLAGICLVDGTVAAVALRTAWPLACGLGGMALTVAAQRWAPGD